MSFIKKLKDSAMPGGGLEKKHPFHAYRDEKKRGGSFGSALTAAADPGELFGNNRTQTAKESAASLEKQKKKAAKRKAGMRKGGKTVRKMAKGGSTNKKRACCRGMGAATRGGSYGK